MSEKAVKVTGITGTFIYFVYGLAYFAFLSALMLATNNIIIDYPLVQTATHAFISLFDNIGGSKSIAVTASALCFISLITGILLNDMAKKLTIIGAVLLMATTLIGVVTINIMTAS